MNIQFGEDVKGPDDLGWLRSERSIVEETRRRLSLLRGELQTLGFRLGAVSDYSAADDDDEALDVLQAVSANLSELLRTLAVFPLVGVDADVWDVRSMGFPTNAWVMREAWMRSSGGGCRNVPALREVVELLVRLQLQLVARLDDLRSHESIREWHDAYCWAESKHGGNLYAIAEKMYGEAKVLLGQLQLVQVALVLAVQMGHVATDNEVASTASPAPVPRPRAA